MNFIHVLKGENIHYPVVTLLTSISTFTTYLGLALLAFYRTGQQKHIGQCGLFLDRML